MASGGKAINLGELAIAIALKTGALEAGLKDVQNKLKDHGKKVQSTSADYDKLAIVAGVAFYKISSAISSGTKAFNDYNNSMVGLKSVVQGTGNDFSQAQGFIDSFTKDGLVAASDAATGLKNLLSHGMGFDQAVDVMNRFKDSAAFARQGSLTLGEAIKGGTEGLKNSMSMMVDNTGVTENLSVMWDKYATTIGKTAASLTDAEKVQAEYVGIMRATQFQVGDAAKYSEQFAGAQAKNTAETLKLKQAFGESLVPALTALLSVITPIISAFTTFTKNNPELVAAIALTVTGFLGIITVVTATGAAINIVTPALAALKISLAGLMVNPVVLALTALAAVAGVVATQMYKAKKSQEEYNSSLEKFNKIKKEGITKTEIPQIQEEVNNTEKLIKQYDTLMDRYRELRKVTGDMPPPLTILDEAEKETGISANKLAESFRALGIDIDFFNGNAENARKKLDTLKKAIRDASVVRAEEYSSKAKAIAQDQASVKETQNLINAYNSAKKGSQDWYDAQQKLADQYPQFSTASGIKIKAIKDEVTAKQNAVTKEWTLLQSEILMTKLKVQAMLAEKTAALALVEADKKALESDRPHNVSKAWQEKYKQYKTTTTAVNDLKTQLLLLDNLLNTDPKDLPGVKPINGGTGDSGIKAYENKALESALKVHNHKVAMEELTKEQELADLQTILKAYAKTADERMSLEEQIFQVKQAIREKDLAATEKAIDDEAKKLADRTSNSERWIQRQKAAGNLTEDEEIVAYNAIIKYHKEYLAKIKADTKIAKDEKEKIIAEETRFIQDQQDKILDIQKTAVEKAVNNYINAKKKQYATEESLENDRLNKKLKALDKEYSDKEKALKTDERNTELSSLYEEERKYENAATKAGQDKLKDIRSQIAALNKEATQDALDTEKETRQAAIEQEIADNQAKYKKLNEDLDTEGAAMIAASANYAKLANDEIKKGQDTIANSLKDIMTNFDKETNTLITTGMENLKKLIEGYKAVMDGISLSPNIQLATAGTGKSITTGKSNSNSVVINDYGDKILSGIEDIQDYGREIVTGAENASRGW